MADDRLEKVFEIVRGVSIQSAKPGPVFTTVFKAVREVLDAQVEIEMANDAPMEQVFRYFPAEKAVTKKKNKQLFRASDLSRLSYVEMEKFNLMRYAYLHGYEGDKFTADMDDGDWLGL